MYDVVQNCIKRCSIDNKISITFPTVVLYVCGVSRRYLTPSVYCLTFMSGNSQYNTMQVRDVNITIRVDLSYVKHNTHKKRKGYKYINNKITRYNLLRINAYYVYKSGFTSLTLTYFLLVNLYCHLSNAHPWTWRKGYSLKNIIKMVNKYYKLLVLVRSMIL